MGEGGAAQTLIHPHGALVTCQHTKECRSAYRSSTHVKPQEFNRKRPVTRQMEQRECLNP